MKVPMPMAPAEACLSGRQVAPPEVDVYGRRWRVERLFSGKDSPEAARAARERDIIPRHARRTVEGLDPRCETCSHLSRNDGPCPGGGATADLPDRQAGEGDPLCHDRLDEWRQRLWAGEDLPTCLPDLPTGQAGRQAGQAGAA